MYSLFQANNIYQKLRRLDRKLALIRPAEDEDQVEEQKSQVKE